MHHPSEGIPWHLLASNLHWAPGELAPQIRALELSHLPGKLKEKDGCPCGVTNLHPTSPLPESVEQDKFARAFTKAVHDASKRKRAQYPEKYSCPSPDDVLLGDELVRIVESHLSQETKGGPRLPLEQRTAYAFLHPFYLEGNTCFEFDELNAVGFLNLEVVKILLMLGELDPILQACAHPDVGLGDWYSANYCTCMAMPEDLGWDMALHSALSAYIALNIALCFPKMWDPAAGRTDETDYRHTGFYQYVLREVTQSLSGSETTPYPHQQFFGIPPEHFGDRDDMYKKLKNNTKHWLHRTQDIISRSHCGLLSFDEFINLEGPLTDQYQPLESDVETVKRELLSRKLPLEIILMILKFADYKAKRVLTVAHDPLHPDSRAELDQYLDQCWQIIIGCEIMKDASGGNKLNLQALVHRKVKELFEKSTGTQLGPRVSITGKNCTDR